MDARILDLLGQVLAGQQRQERQLAQLIAVLAADDEVQASALTLDGHAAGAERTEGTPL